MHILFVDESGTPPKPSSDLEKEQYFVIGGAIVHDVAWHRIKNKLLGMKTRLKVRGELKWRYFAPGNTDKTNPLRDREPSFRDIVRTEMFSIMAAERALTCLACVTDAKTAYQLGKIKTQEDLYHATYKPVSERFQYFLQDFGRNTGRKELGIIVSDHRGSREDKNLRQHHNKLLHSSGEFISKYDNLVESLFFQPSNISVGIQLADLVAGAVWRKYQRADDRWYKVLEKSFRKSATGQVAGYGVVTYPKIDAGRNRSLDVPNDALPARKI